jgi:hypothetical protein
MRSISSVFASTSASICFHPLPHAIEQPAQRRTQILFGVFDDGGEALSQLDGPSRIGHGFGDCFGIECKKAISARPVKHGMELLEATAKENGAGRS